MVKLRKGNEVMAVRDKNQLAAFINNGWKEEIDTPKETEEKLTKTDVNRMSKAELLTRAKAVGVENVDDMTGEELKKCLLNIFGL